MPPFPITANPTPNQAHALFVHECARYPHVGQDVDFFSMQALGLAQTLFSTFLLDNAQDRAAVQANCQLYVTQIDAFRAAELDRLGRMSLLLRQVGLVFEDGAVDELTARRGPGNEFFPSDQYRTGLRRIRDIVMQYHELLLHNGRTTFGLQAQNDNVLYNVSDTNTSGFLDGDVNQNNGFNQLHELFCMVSLQINSAHCVLDGDTVMRPVYAAPGPGLPVQFCNCYEESMLIIEFMYSQANIVTNKDMWKLALSQNQLDKACAEKIRNYPGLVRRHKRDRHTFAFRNGVYLAHQDRFLSHDEYAAEFGDMSACKFFDVAVDANVAQMGYAELEPFLDDSLNKIFRYQSLSEGVVLVIKALVGRLLYDLKERDNWQVVLLLFGVAGSGKSCLCEVATKFYNNKDIGVLAADMEGVFGLQAVHDKLAFVLPELGKMRISPATWKLIVEGGPVKVNVKYETARDVDWKVPGIVAGNMGMPMPGEAGSQGRRHACVRMTKKVESADLDATLDRKLEAALPYILVQCNKAYRYLLDKHGREAGFWAIAAIESGSYFLDTRMEMEAQANSIMSFFLNREYITLDPNACCPEPLISQLYGRYCDTEVRGRHPIAWTPIETDSVYQDLRLKKSEQPETRMYSDKLFEDKFFVYGCDITAEQYENLLHYRQNQHGR